MKTAELRELTDSQLDERLEELNATLFKSRFSAKVGSLEDPTVISKTRREISRVKTILTEKKAQG